MEESRHPAGKSAFHCTRCHGRIVAPRDLPATTAPCPYCGEMVTSPAPPEQVPWPKPGISDASVQAPPTEKTTADPKPAATPAAQPLRQTAACTPARQTARPDLRKDWLPLAGFFLLLAIGSAIAVHVALRKDRKTATFLAAGNETVEEMLVRENHYIRSGWRRDAERVLAGFIAASSVRDKLPFVIGGASMEPRMREFYGDQPIDDSDTPAASFAVHELSEDDRRRGMFLMVFDLPPQIDMRGFFKPLATLEVQYGLEEADMLLSSIARTRNYAMDPLRVHAFFKRTADGLKLDWEVFVQTKYRLFEEFLESPEAGRSAVFRVLVMQDVADAAQSRAGKETYLMADPSHRSQTARVAVARDSEIGRILSEINWLGKQDAEPKARSATVELAWSGAPGARTLEIRRFICWEFLGLGGVESKQPENEE